MIEALLSTIAGFLANVLTDYLRDLRRDRAFTDAGRLEAERDTAAAAARTADAMAQAGASVRPGDGHRRLRDGTF